MAGITRRVALLSAIWLSLPGGLFYSTAQPANGRLTPNSILPLTIAGDQEVLLRIDLEPGQIFNVGITEKQGMAGILTVLAADGSELVEAELGRRRGPAESVVIPPGAATLRIRPANHSGRERIFQLRSSEPRPVTDRDRLRISAEQQLGVGERIQRNQASGYLDAALKEYGQSLQLWTQVGDIDRQADALLHVAFAHYGLNDLKTSQADYQRALDLSTKTGDRAGMGSALYGLALVAGDSGQGANAEAWANQALEIRRRTNDLRGQAETLLVMEAQRFTAGKSQEARSLCLEILDLARQAGDRLREGDGNNFLGVVEHQLGEWQEATAHYSRALEISREENDQVRAATALGNLAVVHGGLGDKRQALADLEQVIPIQKMVSSPNAYATSLYNAAVSHADLGEYETALQQYREALGIFQRTAYPRGQGFVLRAFGNLYLATGEDTKAESYFQQALAQWRQVTDRTGEVLALNSLGDIASRRREFGKAAELHRQALAICRIAGFRRDEARTLTYLANVARETDEPAEALKLASNALQLARDVGDKDAEASALLQQGKASWRLNDRMPARESLEQALALRTAIGERARQADTLLELAGLERESGAPARARDLASEAIDLFEAVGATAASQESRMQFAATHRRAFDLAIDLAMETGDAARALELSERARARELVDLIRQARLDIRRGVDPDLLARERRTQEQLDSKHDRLTRLLSGNSNPAREAELRKEVDQLVDQYQSVEAEIRAKSPEYAALTQPRPLSMEDLQGGLPDAGTALIEFWLGERRSYAWVVTRTRCQSFTLPPAADLEGAARRAYQALNARNQTAREPAEQKQRRLAAADAEFTRTSVDLSRKVLAPIWGAVKARRLWIVSDGALEYLPFAALPLPGATEPLVTAHEIVRLASASVLAEVRAEISKRPRATRGIAVFADPVFRADDERVRAAPAPSALPAEAVRDEDSLDFSALPRLHFSREEANAIAALAPARVWRALDFQANRNQAQKPELRNYRTVHFATHAVLDDRHPELSGIVLSLVDRQGRPQDGFLRLHEIYNLKLAADLVVLSACRTALGQEVRSEGLVGLTRGFMYAGVPQVVASLWSVQDRATADLMRAFYEALLLRRLTPEAALRAAQLTMRRDPRWSQPYYWAAFTVEGASDADRVTSGH